jgi:hypothetical protein
MPYEAIPESVGKLGERDAMAALAVEFVRPQKNIWPRQRRCLQRRS